jgi:cytochrome c2
MLLTTCLLGLAGGCASSSQAESTRTGEQRREAERANPAGQAVYDTHCGSCHRLGEYDADGHGNLARRLGDIDRSFLAGHHGSSLTETDLASLREFIAVY